MRNIEYSIVITTASSREEAEKISSALIEDNLAACVQLLPINSVFKWDGKVQFETEILMLVKSKSLDFKNIESTIIENHSYEVPEIIKVGIDDGFSGYLDWISSVTR